MSESSPYKPLGHRKNCECPQCKLRREWEVHDKWLKRIAKGCKNMKEPPYIGIPSLLPLCELTHGPCRIDTCPKVKKEAKP